MVQDLFRVREGIRDASSFSPGSVDLLSPAVFETHIEDTSGPQVVREVFDGYLQAVGWDVKEGGAGPDTVVFIARTEVLESGDFHWLSDEPGGSFGDFRYGVDGMNGIALADEVMTVPAAAAAGVQDGTAPGNEREKLAVKGGEVQFGCSADEIVGIIGVEREGIGHLGIF